MQQIKLFDAIYLLIIQSRRNNCKKKKNLKMPFLCTDWVEGELDHVANGSCHGRIHLEQIMRGLFGVLGASTSLSQLIHCIHFHSLMLELLEYFLPLSSEVCNPFKQYFLCRSIHQAIITQLCCLYVKGKLYDSNIHEVDNSSCAICVTFFFFATCET